MRVVACKLSGADTTCARRSVISVVHVTFGLDVGGQEKLLVELARHTDPGHFALTFVSLGDRGALAGDVEACGARVLHLGEPAGLKPGLFFKLLRLFLRERPAVVHTHDLRGLVYAVPAAFVSRVPMVVHTRHGRDVNSSRRQTAIFKKLSMLIDRFVCVSEDVAILTLQQGVADGKIDTIKNGVDLEQFAFSPPHRTGPIVTVARLSPEKDLANLIRATALAVERSPDLRVEVAGDGPCLEDLKRLAGDLGVAGYINFLGEVRDVPGLLAGARMFVLPSRSEGIPLTVLEAMARGLPVVATRVGGLPEVVDHGVTGLLVPTADPVALADAVVTIWNDPDLGDRMGRAGRRRTEKLFDVRRMVAQYEAMYRDGIGGDRQSDIRMTVASRIPAAVESSKVE